MLEKVKHDIMICGRCGQCIVSSMGYVCPVQQHTAGFDEYAAKGHNSIAKAVMQGRLEVNDDVVDNAYTCLMCKRCGVACTKENADGSPAVRECSIIQELRYEIAKEGKEPEVLKKIDSTIESKHNPFGLAPAKRAAWADGLDLPKTGEAVYFAGCYASYRNPKLAKATVEILKAGGIDVAYMGEDEWCCGVPQLADGDYELVEQIVMHNIEALQAAGCKKIITSCAGCYHALKSEYADIAGDMPFEVVHTSEVIADLVKEGKIKLDHEVPMKVTYHDPCHLGRHEEVYDAPREILDAIPGLELEEMPRNREAAWCCGGGAIISNIYPDLTADIAADRVEEAQGTGAEEVISACPSCEDILGNAGRKSGLKSEDINLVVAKAMGLDI